MLNEAAGFDKIYIATGYTDLRRGIDGLVGMIQQEFKLDPFQNTLFLFCGKRTDRIKAIIWEGDGFVLLYKRLESGRYQWPRDEQEAKTITPGQFRWLMEGLAIEPGFVAVALLTKAIGCGIGAKMSGFDGKDSLKIGVGMMARGEVALIVAQKGLNAGLMEPVLFSAVIALVIVSSIATPIILKVLYREKNPKIQDQAEEVAIV